MSLYSILHKAAARLTAWLVGGMGLLLVGCGGEDQSSTSAPTAQAATASSPVAQSNLEIAALIYSDTQRTPAGFNLDTAPSFSGYVATSHLKTRDINADAVLQYELCTDDYNEASSWSDTANANSGDNAMLLSTVTTDEYFEFDRLRDSTPQGYLRQRVYRCGYLSRNTVDLPATAGDAGMLNARPLDAQMLRNLSEYLWQFTAYNNFGNVVLLSTGSSAAATLTHSLFVASLATGGACDTITVNEWTHTVDTSTGELMLSVTPRFSFDAQQSGGSVMLC